MNYFGNYGNYPQQPYQQPQPQRLPPSTNKVFVVSLDDALSRFSSPNSVMLYVLQDETMVFEVYTDEQGKKSFKARQLVDAPTQDGTNGAKGGDFVSRQEFDELKAMVEALKGGGTA